MAHIGEFDSTTVEPRKAFEALPEGKYIAVIIDSEVKDNKNGEGRHLCLTLEIVDGPHKGRRLWERLNLWNKSTQAVEIARGTLSAICAAVGVPKIIDSMQLHDIPLAVTVGCKRYHDTVVNEVKAYKPRSAVLATLPAQTATAQGAAFTSQTAPWAR